MNACPLRASALLDRRRVPLDSLRRERFVAGRRGSSCHAFARALCDARGFEPEIAYETGDMAFTGALVDSGAGVAVMPELLIASSAREMLTRELSPAVPPRRISAVFRASARGLRSVQAALAALAG